MPGTAIAPFRFRPSHVGQRAAKVAEAVPDPGFDRAERHPPLFGQFPLGPSLVIRRRQRLPLRPRNLEQRQADGFALQLGKHPGFRFRVLCGRRPGIPFQMLPLGGQEQALLPAQPVRGAAFGQHGQPGFHRTAGRIVPFGVANHLQKHVMADVFRIHRISQNLQGDRPDHRRRQPVQPVKRGRGTFPDFREQFFQRAGFRSRRTPRMPHGRPPFGCRSESFTRTFAESRGLSAYSPSYINKNSQR